MAEGLLRDMAGDRFEVFSAGVAPSKVHPMSVIVMGEIGIDITNQTSDSVDDYLAEGIDIVVTVCDHAQQTCPTFPGQVERIHWSTVDPFHGWGVDPERLPDYRKTRDELKERIEKFLAEREFK